jgi:hypothetical protein
VRSQAVDLAIPLIVPVRSARDTNLQLIVAKTATSRDEALAGVGGRHISIPPLVPFRNQVHLYQRREEEDHGERRRGKPA